MQLSQCDILKGVSAPKIISLLAFIGWTFILIYRAFWTFALAEESLSLQETFFVFLWGLVAIINLGYFIFLRKRSRENKVPKYATSIALLLALAPPLIITLFFNL